ncbi:TPA: hypothetical protein ACF23I_004547 [Escherichia coli]
MNDLQNKIYQLLNEMDSSENDQIENDKGGNVEKSKSKCKEKFLCLSSRPISLGKRSTSAETEIEEKPEVEHLLNIVEKESIKDKE